MRMRLEIKSKRESDSILYCFGFWDWLICLVTWFWIELWSKL